MKSTAHPGTSASPPQGHYLHPLHLITTISQLTSPDLKKLKPKSDREDVTIGRAERTRARLNMMDGEVDILEVEVEWCEWFGGGVKRQFSSVCSLWHVRTRERDPDVTFQQHRYYCYGSVSGTKRMDTVKKSKQVVNPSLSVYCGM
jgi:hypothetical protein